MNSLRYEKINQTFSQIRDFNKLKPKPIITKHIDQDTSTDIVIEIEEPIEENIKIEEPDKIYNDNIAHNTIKDGEPTIIIFEKTPKRKRRYRELGINDSEIEFIKNFKVNQCKKKLKRSCETFRRMSININSTMDILNSKFNNI